MDGRFAGKVILITGAASGIGRRTAERLVAEGALVLGADLSPVAIDGVTAHRLDVTSEAEWEALIADVVARHGRLDVLVNNAGIVEFGDPETLTEPNYRKIMAVSLDGVVFGTKHAIPAMAANGGGSIVNMASIAAIQGEPTFAAYSAAKGAIDAYTRATAAYSIKNGRGVRANSVLPAGIDTPMVQSLGGKLAALGAAAASTGPAGVVRTGLGQRAEAGGRATPSIAGGQHQPAGSCRTRGRSARPTRRRVDDHDALAEGCAACWPGRAGRRAGAPGRGAGRRARGRQQLGCEQPGDDREQPAADARAGAGSRCVAPPTAGR
jgi:3(or 17)beta-hydroxysteroid dehydrogenase